MPIEMKGRFLPSIPSIAGGAQVRGVDGSERTVWWLLAGRRGAVGIAWESSDAYRNRHLYAYSQRRGGGILARVANMLGTDDKEYISTSSGDARDRAKLLVKSYFQYCYLTRDVSGWRLSRDPAAVGCVRQLWPYDDTNEIIRGFRDGDPVLTRRQADAFG